jgi:hypothetical protein
LCRHRLRPVPGWPAAEVRDRDLLQRLVNSGCWATCRSMSGGARRIAIAREDASGQRPSDIEQNHLGAPSRDQGSGHAGQHPAVSCEEHRVCPASSRWTGEGANISMALDDGRLDACRGCAFRVPGTVGTMTDTLLTFADLCKAFAASPDRMRSLLRRPDFPGSVGLSVRGRSRRWFRDEVVSFIMQMEREPTALRQVATVRRGSGSETMRIAGSRRARRPSAANAADLSDWAGYER